MSPEELTAINALTKELEATNKRLLDFIRQQATAAGKVETSRRNTLKLTQEEVAAAQERNNQEKDRYIDGALKSEQQP
mgnify:CR=1 FL=1